MGELNLECSAVPASDLHQHSRACAAAEVAVLAPHRQLEDVLANIKCQQLTLFALQLASWKGKGMLQYAELLWSALMSMFLVQDAHQASLLSRT